MPPVPPSPETIQLAEEQLIPYDTLPVPSPPLPELLPGAPLPSEEPPINPPTKPYTPAPLQERAAAFPPPPPPEPASTKILTPPPSLLAQLTTRPLSPTAYWLIAGAMAVVLTAGASVLLGIVWVITKLFGG
ncbi:MAG TPA: hypothetical protein ENK18_21940 [Deltaproteobacteria bacterium]|nr:hypothetical protein [Deltaproteobacteria bacterium]